MNFIDRWRAELPTTFNMFAQLIEGNKTLDFQYGILGGALLWAVRETSQETQQEEALKSLGGEIAFGVLLSILSGFRNKSPLHVAEGLTAQTRSSLAICHSSRSSVLMQLFIIL